MKEKKLLLILWAFLALSSGLPTAEFKSQADRIGWPTSGPQQQQAKPQVEQTRAALVRPDEQRQPEERRRQECLQDEQQTNLSGKIRARTIDQLGNDEPKQGKHDDDSGDTDEGLALIRVAVSSAANVTLLRRRRGQPPSEQQPANDEQPATIQALVGGRLVLPCTNLTAAAGSQQPDQLSRPNAANQAARRQPPPQQQQQQQARARQPAAAIISLIVWHKDDPQLSSPIFTIDARASGGALREARQQTYADWLKGRAHFEEYSSRAGASSFSSASAAAAGQTPALVIDEARQADAGLYTCTVEFHKAPTQIYQIRVDLIGPPRDMVIRDSESGISVSPTPGAPRPILGPFDEDSRIGLVCEVEAGKPASQVSWWQLSSLTSIPSSASFLHQRPAEQLQRSVVITSNSLANFDHLTTMLSPDDGNGDGAGNNLFVGLHSRPFRQTDDLAALLPSIGHDGAGGRKLKHWNRVKDVSLSIGDKIQATVQLSPLSRAYQGAEFLCMANNNNQLAWPLNSSVVLAMNLKPNEVRIVNRSSNTFRFGEKIMIECQVQGSRPRAQVRWFKDKQPLEQQQQNTHSSGSSSSDNNGYLISDISSSSTSATTNSNNSNFTQTSYLTLVPQLSDNMRTLSCVASNPSMSNVVEPLSDSIVMNVQYPPQLKLQLGSGIRPEMIKVGSDVFMECNIESNPPIDDLTWYFNDQPVYANVSAGTIISNQSLVLQRIRVEHRGKYQCAAQNIIGRSISNKLDLRPKFEPICDYSLTKTRYEVAINQQIRVACNVLAEPSDDLHFVWKFNQSSRPDSVARSDHQSAGTYWMEDIKQYETNFTSSHAIFSPKSRRQYGQLLCYASNAMGKQAKPCVISLVAPELPEPVFKCFFDGITDTSFSVYCEAPDGDNNNGRQSYLLEVFESGSSTNKSAGATTTHTGSLKQQRQDHHPAESPEDEDENNDNDGDNPTATHSDEQPGGKTRPANVRLARSDSPSFRVTDLSPATQYTATIYVQNSKGRSRPISLPVNTADSSSSSSLSGSGRVQFTHNNKRLSAGDEPSSLADRLISYLRVDDYLSRTVNGYYSNSSGAGAGSADQRRPPLPAIAGLVLLGSCTLVVVAFLVTRLCRRAGSRASTASASTGHTQSNGKSKKKNKTKKRGKNRIWSASNSLERSLGTKLSTYGGLAKQPAQLERPSLQQLQLTPAHSSSGSSATTAGAKTQTNQSRELAGLGSGSDTSRETNTDSTTLISSANNNCQMIESPASAASKTTATMAAVAVSTVSGSGCGPKMTTAARSSRESLLNGGGAISAAKSPIMMMMRRPQSAASEQHHYQQQQQQHIKGLYSTINRQHNCSPLLAAAAAHSEARQMSIQSDCTSTSTNTNIANHAADLLMQVNHSDHNHHQRQQELQIAAMPALELELQQPHRPDSLAAAAGEPLYVIRSSCSSSSSNFVVPPSCNRMAQNQNCLNSPGPEQQQQQSIRLVGSKAASEHQQQQQQPHQHQQNLGFAGWAYLGHPTATTNTTADNRSGNGPQRQVDPAATASLAYGNGNANAHNHHPAVVGGHDASGALQLGPPIPAGFLASSNSIPVSLSECQHLHRADRLRRYSQEFLQDHDQANPTCGSYLTLAPAGLLAASEPDSNYRQHEYGCAANQQQQQHFIQDLSRPFITYVAAEQEPEQSMAMCSGGASFEPAFYADQADSQQLHQCQTLDHSFRQTWRAAGPEPAPASLRRRGSFDRARSAGRQQGRSSGQRVKFDDHQHIRDHPPEATHSPAPHLTPALQRQPS